MPDESRTLANGLVLQCLPVGPLFMNAYLLLAPHEGEAVLIDPGDEAERLIAAVTATGCRLSHLLCTHAHFDHVSAAAEIQDRWPLPLRLHALDRPTLDRLAVNREIFGFPPVRAPRIETYDGDRVTLPFAGGELVLENAPGHCPGHVVVDPGGGALIVGDVIFEGSIGRTDLPGGDFATLERTIRERIYSRDEDIDLYCGHGPPTRVGRERRRNPFVRG